MSEDVNKIIEDELSREAVQARALAFENFKPRYMACLREPGDAWTEETHDTDNEFWQDEETGEPKFEKVYFHFGISEQIMLPKCMSEEDKRQVKAEYVRNMREYIVIAGRNFNMREYAGLAQGDEDWFEGFEVGLKCVECGYRDAWPIDEFFSKNLLAQRVSSFGWTFVNAKQALCPKCSGRINEFPRERYIKWEEE